MFAEFQATPLQSGRPTYLLYFTYSSFILSHVYALVAFLRICYISINIYFCISTLQVRLSRFFGMVSFSIHIFSILCHSHFTHLHTNMYAHTPAHTHVMSEHKDEWQTPSTGAWFEGVEVASWLEATARYTCVHTSNKKRWHTETSNLARFE